MLARSMSGGELPELLYKEMVFEKTERPADYADVALCLAMRNWIRKTVEVSKNGTACVIPKIEGDGDLSAEGVAKISSDVDVEMIEAAMQETTGNEDETQPSEEQQQGSEKDKDTESKGDTVSQESITSSKGRKKKKKSKKITN